MNVAGGRAGVEVLVTRQHEESPVRIEGRLEQLAQELAEQAAAVHARLVQSCKTCNPVLRILTVKGTGSGDEYFF